LSSLCRSGRFYYFYDYYDYYDCRYNYYYYCYYYYCYYYYSNQPQPNYY